MRVRVNVCVRAHTSHSPTGRGNQLTVKVTPRAHLYAVHMHMHWSFENIPKTVYEKILTQSFFRI